MTETTQVPQGTTDSGKSNQQGKAGEKPESQKSPEGESVYQRLQADRDKAMSEARKWKQKYEDIDDVDALEQRAKKAEEKAFIAEAKTARNELIEKEFSHLKGREKWIPLGTVDEMRESAKSLMNDFSIQPAASGEPSKGEATSDFTATVNRLLSLPEAVLKEELKKQPKEVIEKFYAELKTRKVI